MTPALFRLILGEELTLESLLHHLPTFLKLAKADDAPQRLLIVRRVTADNITPGIALAGLYQHLLALLHHLQAPLAPQETLAQRKRALEPEVEWFAGRKADDIGLTLALAAPSLGMTPEALRKLVFDGLALTPDAVTTRYGDSRRVLKTLLALEKPAHLMDNLVTKAFDARDVALARQKVHRATVSATGETLGYAEAFRNVLDRLTVQVGSAEALLRTDADLLGFALQRIGDVPAAA
jgi:hypothetical protein